VDRVLEKALERARADRARSCKDMGA
jgi:hypothetical protein